MPELPEVEGFRRRLAPRILGKRIERLEVRDAKLWQPAAGLSAANVAGRRVLGLDRRAKILLFSLEADLTLALHLKIAGQLVFQDAAGERIVGGHPYPVPQAALPDASTRFVLSLEGGETLYVNDQRRFAWLRLMPAGAVAGFIATQRYGPDPLDAGFTPELLAARLRARKGRAVKAALLDQTCIAGLGNIYADEALHGARLHPMVRAGDLDAARVQRLHQAIVDVLAVAVPVGGAIVKGDRAVADPASGRDFLRAHGRAGEPCPSCPNAHGGGESGGAGPAGRIVRALLAGRGTYFCPECQPAPPGFTMPGGGAAGDGDQHAE